MITMTPTTQGFLEREIHHPGCHLVIVSRSHEDRTRASISIWESGTLCDISVTIRHCDLVILSQSLRSPGAGLLAASALATPNFWLCFRCHLLLQLEAVLSVTMNYWLSKQSTRENEDRKMNYESLTFLFIWIVWVIFVPLVPIFITLKTFQELITLSADVASQSDLSVSRRNFQKLRTQHWQFLFLQSETGKSFKTKDLPAMSRQTEKMYLLPLEKVRVKLFDELFILKPIKFMKIQG